MVGGAGGEARKGREGENGSCERLKTQRERGSVREGGKNPAMKPP